MPNTAIKQAQRDFAAACTVYDALSNTDREPVAWHLMMAAWEQLRAAIRMAKRQEKAAPAEAAENKANHIIAR